MFFTGLIILIILILVGNYVYHYYNKPTEIKTDFPPANYMAQIGAQCPNMWDISAITQETVTCKNNANIPVKNNSSCGSNGEITFPTITEWPISKKNHSQLTSGIDGKYGRCDFVQQCGSGHSPVAWDGMNLACV